MSNIASISRKVDENSRGAARFLAPRDKKKVFKNIVQDLESAIEQPDVRPYAQKSPNPDTGQGEATAAANGARAATEVPEPQAVTSAEAGTPDAGNAPSPAKRPSGPRMLEKSFSIDKDQYRLLVRYSNMEGLRLEANVSTSEILRHLLDFALAHVDPEKGEVLALRVPGGRAA